MMVVEKVAEEVVIVVKMMMGDVKKGDRNGGVWNLEGGSSGGESVLASGGRCEIGWRHGQARREDRREWVSAVREGWHVNWVKGEREMKIIRREKMR